MIATLFTQLPIKEFCELRLWKILGSPYTGSCMAEGPIGPETSDSLSRVPNPKPYILWCWIDMQDLDQS
jgi:hypothetical protein